jgi:uroporphyrinogen III methyltransferase/synthase
LKLKVVARNSNLSLKQVEEIFKELNKKLEYEIIPILSYGDKHKEISLMDNIPEDFFTKELDEALLNDEADIAIHSAKDLPFPLPNGLDVIALTKGKTQLDALVSRNNLSLMQLPPKARIGLSSELRKKNVLSKRKDLEIVSIRGTIEERLKLIEDGYVDAIIVAACALERLGLSDRITEILPFETHPLQGKLAVVAKSNRPELRKLFFDIDERKFYGKVYLVGAGPGEVDLLTIKAKECLYYADVILYDDLINPEILEFASKNSTKIYVGKRNGKHSIEQEEINKMLYKFALEGKNVARLKGGDPLVFGKAQEEINYLLERFVSVEIINGISAAFSSAATLGISLTNRKYGSRIIFESGHIKGKEHKDRVSSYIFYMGASSKKEIYEKLKKELSDNTLCAVVQNASLPEARYLITNLKNLPVVDLQSPVIIIAGEVLKHSIKQNRILYTGINPFETLSKIPGVIVYYPLIKREKITPLPEIDFKNYEVIIFTSQFAVDVFTDYYGVHIDKKVYAIGERTKEKLIERGYKNIILPLKYDSYALYDLLVANEYGKPILYPCSNKTSNSLLSMENITPLVVYRTVETKQKLLDLTLFDGIYFPDFDTLR